MEQDNNQINPNSRKRLVVLGGGESGVGAAILAKDKGMDVFLSDMGAVAPRYAAMLDAEEIAWEQGGHTEQLILNADEVVKSPGIPPTAPIVRSFSHRLWAFFTCVYIAHTPSLLSDTKAHAYTQTYNYSE